MKIQILHLVQISHSGSESFKTGGKFSNGEQFSPISPEFEGNPINVFEYSTVICQFLYA
jgi:hypothetical protein